MPDLAENAVSISIDEIRQEVKQKVQ